MKEAILLEEFNNIKVKFQNNEVALKYINLYITICEDSLTKMIPISEMSLDNFQLLINRLKEE